jgi:hypothetical protein
MHTTEGTKFRFFHNGDFDGDVDIAEKKTGNVIVSVPFSDLKALVASWAQGKKVRNLENADDDTILLG